MKQCITCKEFKDIAQYHHDKSRKDGRSNRCKKCRCKYGEVVTKQCRACGDPITLTGTNNKGQVYCGRMCQSLYLKYGINEYKYEDILISQDYKCAICQTEINSKNTSIDHCHSTGHVRGILCTACNTGIGLMRDNVKILQSAIHYLQHFDENKPKEIREEFCGDVKYIRKRHIVKNHKACPSFDAKKEYERI